MGADKAKNMDTIGLAEDFHLQVRPAGRTIKNSRLRDATESLKS